MTPNETQFWFKIYLTLMTMILIPRVTIPLLLIGLASYFPWKSIAKSAFPIRRTAQTTAAILFAWFIVAASFWFKKGPTIHLKM